MKLLLLADIHGHVKAMPSLSDEAAGCDAVVLAGDITNFGGPAQLLPILDSVESFGKPIIAVPGNCDNAEIDQELQRRGYSVHANVILLNDFAFLGVGGSLPCPGHTPNESGESVFQDILAEAAKMTQQKPVVLVTHQPPWGKKLDTTTDGRHTGSRAIRDFIEQYKPVLAVSGHMHEAFGTDSIGNTKLVNPGAFRQGRYAIAELTGDKVSVKLFQLKT